MRNVSLHPIDAVPLVVSQKRGLRLRSLVHDTSVVLPMHIHNDKWCVSLVGFMAARQDLCPFHGTNRYSDEKCSDCFDEVEAIILVDVGEYPPPVIGFGPIYQNNVVVRGGGP